MFEDTTQTVFGKGAIKSPLILVGEQPGDVEDKRGLPFVGPAGAVLWFGKPTLVTYHPSAVLRADDRAAEVRAALVADLRDAYRRSSAG